jgi:branched-chain amino acid transport system permease protein
MGWAVAKICVRLKSDYLAMASIGIAEILRLVIVNESWLTNGSLGHRGHSAPVRGVPGAGPLRRIFVFLAYGLGDVCSSSTSSSRCGSTTAPGDAALRAIRDNEESARGRRQEYRLKYRVQTFVIGSAFMGVAGASLGALFPVPLAIRHRSSARHFPDLGDADGRRVRQQQGRDRRGARRSGPYGR